MKTKERVTAQRLSDFLRTLLLRLEEPESCSSLSTPPSPLWDNNLLGEKLVLNEPDAHATEETPRRAVTFLYSNLGSLSARLL